MLLQFQLHVFWITINLETALNRKSVDFFQKFKKSLFVGIILNALQFVSRFLICLKSMESFSYEISGKVNMPNNTEIRR